MATEKTSKRKRGNGEGTLFQREGGRLWIASWYGGDGKRRERSTRTTSKTNADRMLRTWVERAAMEREGLVAPEGGTELDRHAAATIEIHLEAFVVAKRAGGKTERHITDTATMIREARDGCGWKTLGDMKPESLERFVARKQEPTTDADGNTPRAWTPRTAHKYLTALRTFTLWCVRDGRLAADPLARIEKPTPTRQRERRFLLVEEWQWLRSLTESGPERWGMTGPARRMLYEAAIQTGLRSTELRSLTRSSLVLDNSRPHVLLPARDTKNNKAARQYIRPELAADLSRHAARMMPGSAVFQMPRREYVASMLREDLGAARKAWLEDARADAVERVRRESSDFLCPENHDGKVLDFHAMRHTCGAWAALGGASPKAIQTLMRHFSITMTLDVYGHLLPDEASETVGRMPVASILPLRLTGTHGNTEEPPAVEPATSARFGAKHRVAARWAQTKNASGSVPKAIFKRGGRDSNPQPPDRQSGGAIRNVLENKALTSSDDAEPAVEPATDSGSVVADPELAGLVERWPDLTPKQRRAILAIARWEGGAH